MLVATGAAPAHAATRAQPDGERILTWEQVYDLDELPEQLIVVGSGVTGAEFASAYNALGVDVDAGLQPRPGAARRGRRRRRGARGRVHPPRHDGAVEVPDAVGGPRTATRVTVTLTDGRTRRGLALPAGARLGAEHRRHGPGGGRGRRSTTAGFVDVDRVSRTSARGVYAAGDCTGVLMLASVAAMQGRIAMWHFLGDAVAPLDLQARCPPTSSPPPRSPPSAGRRTPSTPARSTPSASSCRSRATRARRCRASATAS